MARPGEVAPSLKLLYARQDRMPTPLGEKEISERIAVSLAAAKQYGRVLGGQIAAKDIAKIRQSAQDLRHPYKTWWELRQRPSQSQDIFCAAVCQAMGGQASLKDFRPNGWAKRTIEESGLRPDTAQVAELIDVSARSLAAEVAHYRPYRDDAVAALEAALGTEAAIRPQSAKPSWRRLDDSVIGRLLETFDDAARRFHLAAVDRTAHRPYDLALAMERATKAMEPSLLNAAIAEREAELIALATPGAAPYLFQSDELVLPGLRGGNPPRAELVAIEAIFAIRDATGVTDRGSVFGVTMAEAVAAQPGVFRVHAAALSPFAGDATVGLSSLPTSGQPMALERDLDIR